MDRGKSKITLKEAIHAKKQQRIPSQDVLFLGGMSTTRASNTTLDIPTLHTPFAQTPNLLGYLSHTLSSESPMFSINKGRKGSFPGLNPTKMVLSQRRRRENERHHVVSMLSMEPKRLFGEAPSTQRVLSHQKVTHKEPSLDLPLTDILDASVDLSLNDITDDYVGLPLTNNQDQKNQCQTIGLDVEDGLLRKRHTSILKTIDFIPTAWLKKVSL